MLWLKTLFARLHSFSQHLLNFLIFKGKQRDKKQESKKMDGHAHLHVPEDSSERDSSASFQDDPDSVAISRFLSDKQSQQSIVELRNRMSKYYTVSTQLR